MDLLGSHEKDIGRVGFPCNGDETGTVFRHRDVDTHVRPIIAYIFCAAALAVAGV